MTKEEFRKRWDSGPDGGDIAFEDIAKCATKWGLYATPRIHPINEVMEKVVKAAKCKT